MQDLTLDVLKVEVQHKFIEWIIMVQMVCWKYTKKCSGSGVFTCSNTNQLTFKTHRKRMEQKELSIQTGTESIQTMQLLEIAQ